MNNKALLIGNDINNATSSYSWNDLITGLLAYARLPANFNRESKPFPLLYEEIYLKSLEAYGTSESRIKQFIASQTRKLRTNPLHEKILDLGIENILTTNYDLLFEDADSLKSINCKNNGIIKESLYSLFRFHQTTNHKIWHLHGSESNPKSITLGYEHYSGYLQQMRNYVTNGTKGTYKAKDFLPLSKRIKENRVTFESWVDIFFTNDLYIFGLNLDFVEMHLWWLLTYRARAKTEGKFLINNSITYYYPEKYTNISKNKLEMLNCLGVTTKPKMLFNEDKLEYYNIVIEDIKNGA